MALGHGNLVRAIPGAFLVIASYPLVAVDRANGVVGRILFAALLPMIMLLFHLGEAWPPGASDTSVGFLLTLAAVHGPLAFAIACAIGARALRTTPSEAGG